MSISKINIENFFKYIFEMGVNRKFDFRRNLKFCWDLSNAISGGNRFLGGTVLFQVGLFNPLRTVFLN